MRAKRAEQEKRRNALGPEVVAALAERDAVKLRARPGPGSRW